MMTPDDIDVWVGLDVGKSAHHAHALDHDGNTLYDKPLKQDEKAIRTMLGKLCVLSSWGLRFVQCFSAV